MDNAPPKQPDPDDGSATSAADVELDRRLNELRRELLDKRAESINWWLAVMAIVLTFFGIVAVVAGYISFERFGELEKETRNRVEQLVDKIKDLADEAEADAGKIREITAQYAHDFPEKAGEVADETIDNPKASSLDKTIARAVSLQRQDKKPQAIEMWRAVAHVAEGIDNDQATTAWFSVGYLIQDQKDKILAYDQAIRLKPDYAAAYNNRGNAKKELKQYNAAIADYGQAIRLEPVDAAAYNNRGVAKYDLKQYKAAIADYDEAIRLEPVDAAAYNNRGNAKGDLKHYKAAIADYDQALRLKPDLVAAYYNRGVAKYDLKQYKAAIADYDEALRLKPDLAAAYYKRGLVKKALGLKDKARTDLKTARELARNANDAKLVDEAEESLRDLDPDGG